MALARSSRQLPTAHDLAADLVAQSPDSNGTVFVVGVDSAPDSLAGSSASGEVVRPHSHLGNRTKRSMTPFRSGVWGCELLRETVVFEGCPKPAAM